MDQTNKTSCRQLASWKEIAEYLGITVRTAQKWELERGLPVRRFQEGKGRVHALAAELDAWKEARSQAVPPNGPLPARTTPKGGSNAWILVTALAGVVVIVSAIAVLIGGRLGPPTLWRIDLNTLTVQDATGRARWHRTFTENMIADSYDQARLIGKDKAWFGDLDDDGTNEILFNLDYWAEGAEEGVLICYSDSGDELWRFVPGRPVQSRKERFSSNYHIMKFVVAKLVPEYSKSVLVVSYNYPSYPTQVTLLSPKGELVREYWHSGYTGGDFDNTEWLQIADLDGDGRNEAYLGGVSNAYGQATLVVLDPTTLAGASVEEDQDFQLLGFEPGTEIGRVLFPRSCINRRKYRYNSVDNIAVDGSTLSIAVMEELEEPRSTVFFQLDHSLRLLSFHTSDGFLGHHQLLFSEHLLDHPWTAGEEAAMCDIRVLRKSR